MSNKQTEREAYHAGYQAGYENGKRDAVKWISVKERLPNKGDGVAVIYVEDDEPEYLIAVHDGKRWWGNYGRIWDGEITHWCALPEPPEELKGEEGGKE